MKYDIRFREDIELLINTFYGKALKDELISHFFTDFLENSLEEHLQTIYDFWSSILLQEGRYTGMLIPKHIALDHKSNILPEHMERWKFLFEETLFSLFLGPVANDAMKRVETMSQLMMLKIERGRDPKQLL